jgi:hypothetical protein
MAYMAWNEAGESVEEGGDKGAGEIKVKNHCLQKKK